MISKPFDGFALCMLYVWTYRLVEQFTQYYLYPLLDLRVKVMDLEFLCWNFTLKFLGPHYLQTLWWIWFIPVKKLNLYWSKILYSTIPTSYTTSGLEFLYSSFTLKVLGPHYLQTLWWVWFIYGVLYGIFRI